MLSALPLSYAGKCWLCLTSLSYDECWLLLIKQPEVKIPVMRIDLIIWNPR